MSILSKINKIVYGFKETFWNDDIKDLILCFTFILVMISIVMPLTNKIVAPILSVFIVLVVLSYTIDKLYKSGIIEKVNKEKDEKTKK